MEELSKAIAQSEREQLEKMMIEIMHRWNELHEDWELVWMSLPKYNSGKREECLRTTFQVLLKADYKEL